MGDGAERILVPQLVSALLDLNEEAQGIIREVTLGADLGVRDKGGRDDVTGEYVMDAQTEADRRVEAMVLEALEAFSPSLRVVAEESYENAMSGGSCGGGLVGDGDPGTREKGERAPASERSRAPRTARARFAVSPAARWPPHLLAPIDVSRVVVYVDPLDGTNEYAGGERTAVTCLMGVAVDGVPVAGIIGQPFYAGAPAGKGGARWSGRTVWGGPGLGVMGLGEVEYSPERPFADPADPNPPVVCINRVTRERRQEAVMAALGCVVGVRVSATGFHYLSLLERRAHCGLLLREGVKKWDTCAGEALLRATGGAVTDSVGRRYDYSYNLAGVRSVSGMTASVSAAFHRRLTAVVRDVIAPLGDYPYDVSDPSVRPPLLPPPPPGGYRALSVDVGGCLLTPVEPVTVTYTRLAAVHGFEGVTEASAKAAIRAGFAAPVPSEQCGVRYVGDGKSFWRPLVASAMGGASLDDPRLEAVLDDLYAHYEDPSSWHVAHGAREAFTALRGAGVKVAVISNWDMRLPKLLRDCGFDESLLNTVVVSAEEMSDKPDRRIFDVALRRLGIETTDARAVVHVGDSTVNDVQGARAAGFGAALLWNSALKVGNAFDFGELADEIIAGQSKASCEHLYARRST